MQRYYETISDREITAFYMIIMKRTFNSQTLKEKSSFLYFHQKKKDKKEVKFMILCYDFMKYTKMTL